MSHEFYGSDLTALKACEGKRIAHAFLRDDTLTLKFDDTWQLEFFDSAQCCCEHRYMTTDDELSDFVGAEFRGAEVRDAPGTGEDEDAHCDSHDVQAFVVRTSKGDLTMFNHNDHNGYYGGFGLTLKASQP